MYVLCDPKHHFTFLQPILGPCHVLSFICFMPFPAQLAFLWLFCWSRVSLSFLWHPFWSSSNNLWISRRSHSSSLSISVSIFHIKCKHVIGHKLMTFFFLLSIMKLFLCLILMLLSSIFAVDLVGEASSSVWLFFSIDQGLQWYFSLFAHLNNVNYYSQSFIFHFISFPAVPPLFSYKALSYLIDLNR